MGEKCSDSNDDVVDRRRHKRKCIMRRLAFTRMRRGTSYRNQVVFLAFAGALACLPILPLTRLPAATLVTGDVTPLPWNGSTDSYIGFSGEGTLAVDAGSQLESRYARLGFNSGSTGAATISGIGSTWNNSSELYVGWYGSGTLTAADGGQVTAGTLWASLDDLHGDGTITATQGAVLDADLQFDATHGTQAVTSFGSGGTLTVTAAGGTWARDSRVWEH